MDLSDSELFWTRYHKGLVSMEETEEYIRSLEKKIKELEENYIPKSLVREKIEELEKQEDWYIENKSLDELYENIKMLQELLQEGE